MSNSMDLTSVTVAKIICLKEGGHKKTDIWQLTGVRHTSVKKYSRLFREGGSDELLQKKPRCGHPRKISKCATNTNILK